MRSRKTRLAAFSTGVLWLLCLLWSVSIAAAPAAGQEKAHTGQASGQNTDQRPLQFGVLPYMSTRKLFAYYLPVKRYLEETLGRPVRMSTAPDFSTYIKRAREGVYDLYHTAPHFAAQAEYEFGYQRVSRLMRELDGSIVVARDGPIKLPGDFRGRTLGTPDSLAIVTFLGEQWLQDNGLQPGSDVGVKNFPSHNTAILAVLHGEVDAAVTSAAVFENMSKIVSDKLRILTKTKKVSHMMFMANSDLPQKDILALRKAMLAFTASAAGKSFFASTGYGDMGEITDKEMGQLKPFVAELIKRTR